MKGINAYVPYVIAAIIAGGSGFAGGVSYQASKVPERTGQFAAQGGNGQGFRGAGGARGAGFRGGAAGGFVGGDVIAKDDKSITVKLRSGGSQTVYYSSSTVVSKPTDVSIDAVSVGDQVTASGTPNADGSMTAETIQVRPSMPEGQQPGQGGAQPAGQDQMMKR